MSTSHPSMDEIGRRFAGAAKTRVLSLLFLAAALSPFLTGTRIAVAQESVIYSFGATNANDTHPSGDLVFDGAGNLYGTNEGSFQSGSYGTVFELSRANAGKWTEKDMYGFGATPNAWGPTSGVILDTEGNLYGTTPTGGAQGQGAVYELTPEEDAPWKEGRLFSFCDVQGAGGNCTDGNLPEAPLIFDAKGNLYGSTTEQGANYEGGTIFELTPSGSSTWTEKVLYSFCINEKINPDGGCIDGEGFSDGLGSSGALVFDAQGNLYGTRIGGGPYLNGGNYNQGVVFELMPQSNGKWTEKDLYTFCSVQDDNGNCMDGAVPNGNLIFDAAGNLYGLASGGAYCINFQITCGVAFELMPQTNGTWKEKVLHSFGAQTADGYDGFAPVGGLIFDSQGNLYGATASGGAESALCTDIPVTGGCGTVFELTPQTGGSWTEKVLHSFAASPDGFEPSGGLVFDTSGNLYGATIFGGVSGTEGCPVAGNYNACGTIFEIAGVAPHKPVAATPTFTPVAGAYSTAQPVTIKDTTPGATIFYSTNGSTPTSSSTRYTGAFDISVSSTVQAIAVATGYTESEVASADYIIETPAATPTITPAAGAYSAPLSITITDSTEGAVIYYTTNGTAPTTASTKYTAAFKISASSTVKAIAIATDYTQSAVASAAYTIEPATATPTFSPVAGTYSAAQSVTIKDATAGAVIYYTTNGTAPTSASTKYTAAFKVSASLTVKAIAVASGHSDSAVPSAAYVIETPTATPTFSPAAGTYSAARSVTLKDATKDAVVYYTTNGDTPTKASTNYTAAIRVKASETIKAIAIAAGYGTSAIASAKYTIK